MRNQKTVSRNSVIFPAVAFAGVLLSAVSVFAASETGFNLSALRHQNYNPGEKSTKLVRIEGLLSCDLGAENTGESCNIQIIDNKTGNTFKLIEASGARRLYQNGIKKAAIEGTLTEPQTISVNKAETL